MTRADTQLWSAQKSRWIDLVMVQNKGPQDAAEIVGVPFGLILANRAADPDIDQVLTAIAYKHTTKEINRTVRKRRTGTMQYKERVFKRLFENGVFLDKIGEYLEAVDPKTDEGREIMGQLLRFVGPLLPKETQNEEIDPEKPLQVVEEVDERITTVEMQIAEIQKQKEFASRETRRLAFARREGADASRTASGVGGAETEEARALEEGQARDAAAQP